MWLISLLPWLLIGPLSALAFDAGSSLDAYVFVISALTYPVAVVLVGVLKQKHPFIALLPLVNVALFFISGRS